MTKAELKALEKVFAREIQGLILQSGAQIYKDLEASGHVAFVRINLSGRFPVTVEGYELTHKGRIAYCETCK